MTESKQLRSASFCDTAPENYPSVPNTSSGAPNPLDRHPSPSRRRLALMHMHIDACYRQMDHIGTLTLQTVPNSCSYSLKSCLKKSISGAEAAINIFVFRQRNCCTAARRKALTATHTLSPAPFMIPVNSGRMLNQFLEIIVPFQPTSAPGTVH